MKEITGQFPDHEGFGKKYSRVFQAEDIQDLLDTRAINAKDLSDKHTFVASPVGLEPVGIADKSHAAIIYLPPVQHYPAYDPEFNKGFLGIKKKSKAMKLTDPSGEVMVYPDKHSRLFFPYDTSFHQVLPRPYISDPNIKDALWQQWREVSWNAPVILLAQHLSRGPMHPNDIFDRYWLYHIFQPNKKGLVSETVKVQVRATNPVPYLKPI